MHRRSKHDHVIDYIITRQQRLGGIIDISVLISAQCNTDHKLVHGDEKFDSPFKGKSLCTNLCWINSLKTVLLLRESSNSKKNLLRPFSSRMENIWESRILLEVCRASDRHFTKTLRNLLLNHKENCFWETNGIMEPWSKHFTKSLLDNSIINK